MKRLNVTKAFVKLQYDSVLYEKRATRQTIIVLIKIDLNRRASRSKERFNQREVLERKWRTLELSRIE